MLHNNPMMFLIGDNLIDGRKDACVDMLIVRLTDFISIMLKVSLTQSETLHIEDEYIV